MKRIFFVCLISLLSLLAVSCGSSRSAVLLDAEVQRADSTEVRIQDSTHVQKSIDEQTVKIVREVHDSIFTQVITDSVTTIIREYRHETLDIDYNRLYSILDSLESAWSVRMESRMIASKVREEATEKPPSKWQKLKSIGNDLFWIFALWLFLCLVIHAGRYLRERLS